MRATHRGTVAVAFTLLLVLSMGASVAAVGSSGGGAAAELAVDQSATDQTTGDAIVQTQRYALTPDRPGSVRVTVSYEIPDRVRSLRVQRLENGTVTATDGFDRANATTYEWDGATAEPSVTFRFDPNETTERTGPEAADGRYTFVDAGEWALFRGFRTRTVWTAPRDDQTTVERRLRTAGPGATGERLVYLGAVETRERTANGQTVRLVVPDAAQLRASPEAILDSLTNASASLDIGDRDERVVAFAAPTDRVEWGVRGLAYGESEFWVRDFERLDEPDNVWLHEYVHTRQAFRTTRETRWLTEGTAQYYAALLTLQQDRIGFAAFRDHLAAGGSERYAGAVLSSPETWPTGANYRKGALAAGRIDRSLRASTNRSGQLEDVLRSVSRRDGDDPRPTVSRAAFLDAVAATGGAGPRATAREVTETPASLSMWDRRTHARLFGVVPARLSYGLAGDGYRASGPYRSATVSTTPVRLATGETLTVPAVVRNTGGDVGAYEATLTVDGAPVDTVTGTVAAESDRVVRLAHTFGRPGEYTVGVGEETVSVVVEPPAEPVVTDLGVASQRVPQGDSVVVTATVGNDAAVPANGTVAFTRDGETVARRPVTLAPGERTQVSATVTLPAAGERRLGAGSASATVTVVEPTAEPTSGGSGAGFTVSVAVLAVLVALLARRR